MANWRLLPPVLMDIGPVLHPDDVMAGNMDALYNRAAARDFLDVDAAITSGRYTLEYLCDLAEAVDAGFDRQVFAEMAQSITRFDDDDFIQYDIDPGAVPGLRPRVAVWVAELRSSPPD